MRPPALLSTLVLLALAALPVQAQVPWVEACDAPESSTALWPAPPEAAAADARAVWLDRRFIHWPGGDGTGRVRLYRALRAQMVALPGAPVRGADAWLPLQPQAGELQAALTARVQALGAGPVLALAPEHQGALPLLLREQLMVVQEDEQGRVLRATHLQAAAALDDLYAAAATLPDLGVTLGGGQTGFRLWAPTAQRVSMCLHDGGTGRARARVPMARDGATGAWGLKIGGDLSGHTYAYLIELPVRGRGVLRYRVSDPHVIGLGADARRSLIADLDAPALKPPGWDADAAPRRLAARSDRVVLGLPLRDVSLQGASAERRGQSSVFSELASDGLQPLKALADAGLTDVQLQPAFELVGAPANGGAGDAADATRRILELRQRVMALHAAGLRVGIELAVHHTAASAGPEPSMLDRVVPGYYHRLDAAGAVLRSGCCNLTAPEHRMMGKLVTDAAARWARQLHIDFFSVEALGSLPGGVVAAWQAQVDAASGRSVPWRDEGAAAGALAAAGRLAFVGGQAPAGASLQAADLARAGLAGSVRGYVMTSWRDELLPLARTVPAAQVAGLVGQPGEVLNRFDGPDGGALGAALVLFSQGTAWFQAGPELLRSPSLPAAAGKPPGAAEVRWTRDAFIDLLKIRASSTLFGLRTADEVQGRLLFHNIGADQLPGLLVGRLDGVGLPGAVFRELVYLINVAEVAQSLTIEPLKGQPFELHPVHQAPGAADHRAAAATFEAASGRFTVPARTAVVFVVR